MHALLLCDAVYGGVPPVICTVTSNAVPTPGNVIDEAAVCCSVGAKGTVTKVAENAACVGVALGLTLAVAVAVAVGVGLGSGLTEVLVLLHALIASATATRTSHGLSFFMHPHLDLHSHLWDPLLSADCEEIVCVKNAIKMRAMDVLDFSQCAESRFEGAAVAIWLPSDGAKRRRDQGDREIG